MPEFAPSEVKTAVAAITVRPAGLSCEAEVFLGPDEMTRVATSGRIGFTSTGSSQSVSLPITMPSAEGTYPVYLDVFVSGQLIGAYRATEDVVIIPVGVEITNITVSPTNLTNARHEYNTYLGLGYWGDPFTISITFSNPFNYDVWVRPDYAFGQLTGEPLEYVAGTLRGFVAEKLLYFRLLLDTEWAQGDYSYTVDWQHLYHPQNNGSNMPQFVRDPDGIAVLMAGGDCWLKVPAKGSRTTVKQAHLGVGISVALPAVFDLCVVANKAFYLVYDPHYRTVGGIKYLINWSPVALAPCAAAVPNAVNITPT